MGDPATPERRRHFRGKARPGRRVRLRFRSRGGDGWTVAETRNIGVGGAFILGAHLAPHSDIDVEIDVAGRAAPLSLIAEVRWIAPEGIGVQFHDVDIDVMLELNGYLASLTGTESSDGEPAP
jgi:hypothetical protein